MAGVQVFSDKKFFVLQRVPLRNSFLEDVRRNGGTIVTLEVQADYIIADHARKDAPHGSLSYKFIEEAVRTGELPEEEQHRIGAATRAGISRAISGVSAPVKSTRSDFTAEDDIFLWQWVKQHEAAGHAVKGNEIYKLLEQENPRHTFQSWRSRYVKILMYKPPAGINVVTPPTPPLEPTPTAASKPRPTASIPPPSRRVLQPHVQSADQSMATTDAPRLSEVHLQLLLAEAAEIENIPRNRWDDAWKAWAEHYGTHTQSDWIRFYEEVARPLYLKRTTEQSKGTDTDQQHKDAAPGLTPESNKSKRGEQVVTQPAKSSLSLGPSTQMVSEQPQVSPDQSEGPPAAPPAAPPVRKRPAAAPLWTPFKLPKISATGDHRDTFKEASRPPMGDADGVNDTDGAEAARPETLVIEKRQALTAENLAKVEAVQRPHMLRRAADLPEDDGGEDQAGFADFLASTLPPEIAESAVNARLRLSGHAKDEEIAESAQDLSEADAETTRDRAVSRELESPIVPRVTKQLGLAKTGYPDTTSTCIVKGDLTGGASTKSSARNQRHNSEADEELAAAQLHGEASQKLRTPLQPIVEVKRLSLLRSGMSRNAFAGSTPASDRLRGLEAVISSSPPFLPVDDGVLGDVGPVSESIEHELLSASEPDDDEAFTASSVSRQDVFDGGNALGTTTKARGMSGKLDTQAIYDEETQALDFRIPSFDDILPPMSPIDRLDRRRTSYFLHDTRSPTPVPAQVETDLDDYINEKVKAGADEDHVIQALMATCMQRDLADVALQILSSGIGLPKNVSGIWTAEDDEAITSGEPAKVKAVDLKHGTRETRRREEFLSQHGN